MTNVEIELLKSKQADEMKEEWEIRISEFTPTDFDFGLWVRKYKRSQIMFVIKAVAKRIAQEMKLRDTRGCK